MKGRMRGRQLNLEVCRQIARGEKQLARICRERDLSARPLARWPKEYERRGVAAFTPGPDSEIKGLEAKIAKLE